MNPAPIKLSRALYMKHLSLELDHLLLIQERHLKWSRERHDPMVRNLHRSIAELLGQVASEYEELLASLGLQKDK